MDSFYSAVKNYKFWILFIVKFAFFVAFAGSLFDIFAIKYFDLKFISIFVCAFILWMIFKIFWGTDFRNKFINLLPLAAAFLVAAPYFGVKTYEILYQKPSILVGSLLEAKKSHNGKEGIAPWANEIVNGLLQNKTGKEIEYLKEQGFEVSGGSRYGAVATLKKQIYGKYERIEILFDGNFSVTQVVMFSGYNAL